MTKEQLSGLREALVTKCREDGWWWPQRGTFDLYEGKVLRDYYSLILLAKDWANDKETVK